MRFIRIEKTVKTLCDEAIEDKQDLLKLLRHLRSEDVDLSIIVKRDYHTIRFDRARLVEIKDDSVVFRAFRQSGVLIDEIPLCDLCEIKAETEVASMRRAKGNLPQSAYLDLPGKSSSSE